jgi:hypothetical protein
MPKASSRSIERIERIDRERSASREKSESNPGTRIWLLGSDPNFAQPADAGHKRLLKGANRSAAQKAKIDYSYYTQKGVAERKM